MTGPATLARRAVDAVRRVDARLSRSSGRRRILVDGRTPVNYTMVAPVHRAVSADPRVEVCFTASEEPHRLREIYAGAPGGTRLITPRRAALMKFDAYVASDFMWATLPRGTRRVQVFHGVGGKYGFDAPTTSMRAWDRLLFVNERRLRNFVAAGAIDRDSDAIRLVGMPKVDCLVDGTLGRDTVLRGLDLDPSRPSVLYAPTWSPASSLNAFGLDLVRNLLKGPINVVVKLHDRSRDLRERYSGGRDWMAALGPIVATGSGRLVSGHDICPYLAAADVMITDHSSAGFEYLLLDRPLVRIHRPALIEMANVHADYVALLAEASESTTALEDTLAAVDAALASPAGKSATRRAIAEDLFYKPGTATRRAVAALYEAIELEQPVGALHGVEALCQPSA
ncbi:MAG TPA: CDP-glycerol glycerophosphotransferase family protein [Vicinamibacterales bacterium]|nr:CDP-glycerol glycerophosphotransferase family protein [Vicinamibacterales bacterium]